MPPHKRVNWEFFAVVRGSAAPTFQAEPNPEPTSDALWLFPPGYVHGWSGLLHKKCEVIILHFNSVPDAIVQLAAEQKYLEARLSPRDKRFLLGLVNQLKPHYWNPTFESELHVGRALMDLCLLVMRDYQGRQRPQPFGASRSKVLAAEDWWRQHLGEGCSIAGAARAVGLSSSQLNRVFRKIRKESPQKVLNRLRIERAMELMANSATKLDAVATSCGFSSASNLCRAFRLHKGHPPTAWRKETFIQYKQPNRADQKNHTAHGRRKQDPF